VTSPYVLASFPADPSITPTPTMIDEYLTILNSNPFPVDALELLSPAVTVKLASTAGAIYSSLGTFPTSGNPPIAVTVALNKSCNTATCSTVCRRFDTTTRTWVTTNVVTASYTAGTGGAADTVVCKSYSGSGTVGAFAQVSSAPGSSSDSGMSTTTIIIIAACAGGGTLLIVLLTVFCCCKKKRVEPAGGGEGATSNVPLSKMTSGTQITL